MPLADITSIEPSSLHLAARHAARHHWQRLCIARHPMVNLDRRHFLALGGSAAVSALEPSSLFAAEPNQIQLENLRPGTSAWKIRLHPPNGELEGYASKCSVSAGEEIGFFISSVEPEVIVEIFRLGWYAGAGARRVTQPVRVAAKRQEVPQPDPVTGLIECQWTDPYKVRLPDPGAVDAWPSGYYLAKLTAPSSGFQRWIIFVVRDDLTPAKHLFVGSMTTYQAYNNWGGKSLYAFNSTGAFANEVSFDRPYTIWMGAGDFFNWEYSMLRFLEREGYSVSYATNLDVHYDPRLLRRYSSFLSVGHDEYWSWEMRDHVEQARDNGVNLGFFSSNTSYWQIRLKENSSGTAMRRITCYKEQALSRDPILADGDPMNDRRATTLWRETPVNRPEESLIGVMYAADPVDGDIVIDDASQWPFLGTRLRTGDRLRGLLGYEVDAMHGHGPRNIVRLANSPYLSRRGQSGYSQMTMYEAASGAIVFATGSMQWSWGLDPFRSPDDVSRENPAAQQITRNVLRRFEGLRIRRRRGVLRG